MADTAQRVETDTNETDGRNEFTDNDNGLATASLNDRTLNQNAEDALDTAAVSSQSTVSSQSPGKPGR
jgi:hypothetical protein